MKDAIRCIVVEDYEPLNNIYYNLLNYERDIQVVGNVFDSEGLFSILKMREADVILLDIEMKSRTEGLDVCRKLMRLYPAVKIVMLTCHDEEEMILSAFEAGAVDYVLKTASSAQILDAVRAAYNNTSSLNSYVAYVIRKRMKEFGSIKESILFVMNILSGLTASEMDVLKLLMKGQKQREIAKTRSVELVTVKAHVGSILKKFNKDRTPEVINAIKEAGLQSFIEQKKA